MGVSLSGRDRQPCIAGRSQGYTFGRSEEVEFHEVDVCPVLLDGCERDCPSLGGPRTPPLS